MQSHTVYGVNNPSRQVQQIVEFQGVSDEIQSPTPPNVVKFPNYHCAMKSPKQPKTDMIASVGTWAKSWIPPQYIIGRLVQRRFLGAVTGPAGSYKTAVWMRISVHYALGLPVGDHKVKQPGRVLYLAGENPNEALTRLLALSGDMGFDIDTIQIDRIDKAFPMTAQAADNLIAEAQAKDKVYGLVIVDTAQAYFSGDDANDNPQQLKYAHSLRRLTGLPGGPAVIVLCHPSKYGDKTLPYGGGSFYNEIDGGAYLSKIDANDIVKLTRLQKWRGARFDAVPFEATEFIATGLIDADGEPIESVTVIPRASEEVPSSNAKEDEISTDDLIAALFEHPRAALTRLAQAMGLSTDEKTRGRISRKLQKLAKQGLTQQDLDKHWLLTDAGKALFANKAEQDPNEQVFAVKSA